MNLSEKLKEQDERFQTALQENRRLLKENEKLQLTVNELQGIIRGLQCDRMNIWLANERLKNEIRTSEKRSNYLNVIYIVGIILVLICFGIDYLNATEYLMDIR